MRKAKVNRLIQKFKAEAAAQASAETRKRVMDELTFVINAPEDALVLPGRPDHPYYRVALTPRRPVDFEQIMRGPSAMYGLTLRTANFAATRKSWTSGEGHTVCWYDWEFKGVSF